MPIYTDEIAGQQTGSLLQPGLEIGNSLQVCYLLVLHTR